MKSILQRILTLTLCLALLASCGIQAPVEESSEASETAPKSTTLDRSESPIDMEQPTATGADSLRKGYYYEESVMAQHDRSGRFYRLLAFDDSGELLYLDAAYSEAYITSELKGNLEASWIVGKTNAPHIGQEMGYFSQENATTVMQMDWGKDGIVYAFFYTNGWTEYFIRAYDENMNVIMEDIPLNFKEKYVCEALAVYDGVIYICMEYKIWTIDMDGTMIPVSSIHDQLDNAYGFGINKDTGIMYCEGELKSGGVALVSYDLKQETIVSVSKIEPNHDRRVLINAVSNGFYRTTLSGICFYNQNCEFVRDEIIFGEDSSLKPANWGSLDDVIVDQAGNLYISMTNLDGQSYIFKYALLSGEDPNTNIDDTRIQLSVTAQYPQPFLVDVMTRFNHFSETAALYIDTPYQTRQEWQDNREASITKMLAKIMTNDVGDIIATGGMGLSTYELFQTDAFVDLSDYIKNSPHYDSMNQKYLDAITIDGKIYGLPVGVALNCTVYNQELADELELNIDPEKITWSYLLELARQLERMKLDDVYLFRNDSGYGKDIDSALRSMFLVNVSDLIDREGKTVDFNQEWFVQLLKDVKEVSAYDCFMAPESSQRSTSNYLFCETVMSPYGWVENFNELYPEPLFLPAISGEINRNNLAYSYIMYSISSRSPNKDEAWAFLESLLDESMANLSSFNAIPLNTKAAEGQIRQISFENFPEQAEKISDVDTMYNYANENYDDIVPVFMKYINDEITLEEAIEQAEYNVWLRLNE